MAKKFVFAVAGIITVFILAGIIRNLFSGSAPLRDQTQQTQQAQQTKQTAQPVASTEDSLKAIVSAKLKRKAENDWPDDYTTQKFWVNQQLEAYDDMQKIPDGPLKRQAQRDWPLDFTTQKFWYNQQVEAKERMSN